jgi:hypothetical protein
MILLIDFAKVSTPLCHAKTQLPTQNAQLKLATLSASLLHYATIVAINCNLTALIR